MKEYIILKMATRIMVPFILMFSLYVLAHGEISPGGGFQGGVIFAVGFILYALVFGIDEMHKKISKKIIIFSTAFGVIIYAGVGYVTMLMVENSLSMLKYLDLI